MTKKEVLKALGVTGNMALAVISAKLDNVKVKPYTFYIGEKHYSVSKNKNGYALEVVE